MTKTKKIIIIGLLVGIGLVLNIVESMIPMSFVVPGAKLGLSNVVNLIGLVIFGFVGGFQIFLLRVILGSLLIGTFMTITFYLSFVGGLLGYLMMGFVYYVFKDKFSLLGISVIGAVFHNIGQIITAYILIDNPGIFYYLPYLVLLAIPTGIGVGLVTLFTVDYLPSRAE
ncbi:MAG: Gx transporter family protein [Halanaerobiales bacterium]